MIARRKRRRRIVVKQRARVRKKSERKGTLQRVEGRPPANVAPTFRVKIKKKQ